MSVPALLVLALLAVFGSVIQAQNIPANCNPDTSICTTLTTTTNSLSTTRVSATFYYEPTGATTGTICYLQSFSVVGVKGSPGAGVTADPQNIAAGSTVVFNTVTGGTEIDNIILSFTSTAGASTFGVAGADAITVAGTLGGDTYAPVVLGSTNLGPVDPASPLNDFCSANGVGDPIFNGFLGQRFVVRGRTGDVYNVLSTSNMQMNAGLTKLVRSESMDRGQMRMARLKSLFSLPDTHWFDHDGPYMTELGVAVVGDHQLYAKVGEYADGWATVQVDGVDFTSGSIVFGSGEEAVSFYRPNMNQIVIETADVQLVVTNSANFFNVDKARLKVATAQNLSGILGRTADSNWKSQDGDKEWQREIEKDVLVASGDLFAHSF